MQFVSKVLVNKHVCNIIYNIFKASDDVTTVSVGYPERFCSGYPDSKSYYPFRWGLLYGTERNGTERNGTERNDGLNHGTERFLKLKLATYYC